LKTSRITFLFRTFLAAVLMLTCMHVQSLNLTVDRELISNTDATSSATVMCDALHLPPLSIKKSMKTGFDVAPNEVFVFIFLPTVVQISYLYFKLTFDEASHLYTTARGPPA
jgi:hypothetical protein